MMETVFEGQTIDERTWSSMSLGENIGQLRRRQGLSQEQLADRLGVSRQSVSKWEAGVSTPELGKLIAMADLFQVSLDQLVRGSEPYPSSPADDALLEELGEIRRSLRRQELGFVYTSRRRLWGLPLVDIRLSRYPQRGKAAKGILAIGNRAVGLVAVGGASCGAIAVGGASVGLLTIGGAAVGGLAIGGLSAGILALGGVAVGLCALGGVAVGGQVAVGSVASAPIAIGNVATGAHALTVNSLTDGREINRFLATCPGFWGRVARFLFFLW